MKKLLLLSGKGGTGKTTVAASLIALSQAKAMADCDVDAPNLHLLQSFPAAPETTDFIGGEIAVIDPGRCIGCGSCEAQCRFGAVRKNADGTFSVSDAACEGCGVCMYVCPAQAVRMEPDHAGKLMLYRDAGRTFSSAELNMGRGNSGKLVAAVKDALLSAAPDAPFAVFDGSPGIGCPVMAAISGMDLILIVTEPTVSGRSDLERLCRTVRMCGVQAAVCVNKYDVSPESCDAVEEWCRAHEIPFVGKIPYDRTASAAVNAGKSIIETDCPASRAIRGIYDTLCTLTGGLV